MGAGAGRLSLSFQEAGGREKAVSDFKFSQSFPISVRLKTLEGLRSWSEVGGGGCVGKAPGRILDRRKGFRRKKKNLDGEHSRKPSQDRTLSPHGPSSTYGPSFCCSCLDLQLGMRQGQDGGCAGPGSGQPAPLAG